MASSSLTERLTHHLARPVPGDVGARARLHLLDWMACVAGALESPVAAAVRAMEGGALARAVWLGNVLEMDDVHRMSILHPGPVIWPVALGGDGAPGMDARLAAAVRGYEAVIAIGATFDGYHYARWHNTATAGVFGAAATAASLTGAGAETTVFALGLAGSVAGGLWRMRHEPVMAKHWHVAHAVDTGMAAARAARAGITGPRFVLEGEQGLYTAMTGTPRPLRLGEGWRMDEVSFKPWGACRHTHPAIDAALALRGGGAALEGPILVETYRDALTFCDRPDPVSVADAKFSLHHAVAVVAERGEPVLADFEPTAIAVLAPARSRIEVREAAEFSERFPAHYGARVTAGGRAVERIDTLGDPERPLGRDGVIAKARALMDWGGVGQDADAAIAACLSGDDPRTIVALLETWL
ncbi:MAG: MmgE/PrpD family protein [Novosphingobium sp.]